MNIVAVVGGGGTMGSGIVQAVSQAGLAVLLIEQDSAVAEKAKEKVGKVIQKLVEKGKISKADSEAIQERIRPCGTLEEAAKADLVIEAVYENINLKKEIFKRLDEIAGPEVILASNTSALSITELGSATSRPDKVIGLHFFNPAPVMKLVEVVMGLKTSEETYRTAVEFCARIGKETVRAKDTPGFLVNWLQIPLLNGAVYALENGLASAEDIDKAMVLGCNHPIGPLALLDLIGLDNALDVFTVMYEQTGDMRYRPCTLHKRMVQAGKLGRKTGEGFFIYKK
ncbi:MAG: 3-hydroxybutyryl-CoA dehydrogenase [Armatimonadetes bacterium]|nr:3-hydroxybutyryl-CoA dehydrogenase [Armatimonadota bacterium]